MNSVNKLLDAHFTLTAVNIFITVFLLVYSTEQSSFSQKSLIILFLELNRVPICSLVDTGNPPIISPKAELSAEILISCLAKYSVREEYNFVVLQSQGRVFCT